MIGCQTRKHGTGAVSIPPASSHDWSRVHTHRGGGSQRTLAMWKRQVGLSPTVAADGPDACPSAGGSLQLVL